MIPSFPLRNGLLIAADLVNILHPNLELRMRKAVGNDSSLKSICLFVLLVILLPAVLSHLMRLEVVLTGDVVFLIQLSVVMSLEEHGSGTSSSEIKTTLSYVADKSKLPIEGTAKSYQSIKNDAEQMGMTEPEQEYGVTQQKRAAKIHDFCFGIPYGECALMWLRLLSWEKLKRD